MMELNYTNFRIRTESKDRRGHCKTKFPLYMTKVSIMNVNVTTPNSSKESLDPD